MGRKENNLKEFALGGREIQWWQCSLRSSRRKLARHLFRTPGEGSTNRKVHDSALAIATIMARISSATSSSSLTTIQIFDYESSRAIRRADEECASAVFMITRVLARWRALM